MYVMILFSSLCNKYFGMNTSFRISLMYLLLTIPHHENSPLPVVESWLKKDLDDGFVQRDMTSSLSGGDDSFGSAHQTYQNSLIRKKKADTFGNSLPAANFRNLPLKYDQNQQCDPNAFYKSNYLNKEYSVPSNEKERRTSMYGNYEESKLPYSKFLAGTLDLKSSMGEFRDASLLDLNNNKKTVLKENVKFLNSRFNLPSESEGNFSPVEDFGKSRKWSRCKRLKARFAPNTFSNLPQPIENQDSVNFDDNVAVQSDYLPLEDDQRSQQSKNAELKEAARPGGKSSPVFDENEYYDADENPVNVEEDLNVEEDDYSQMPNEHAFMHKRDDKRQQFNYPQMASGVTQVVIDALKAPDSSKAYAYNFSPLETTQKDLARMKKAGFKARGARDNTNDETDPEMVWKLTSGLQSKELKQLMRNSQKALQEVQQFQQKMSLKSLDANESDQLKRPTREESTSMGENSKLKFEEKRLKREDEDEQKNMKTGTDEGGGGEYEDEEGKGHKDEDEYYEDADLSHDESNTEVQKTSELNQKLAKREITEDKSKNSKEKNDDIAQDYELSLENAPVENAEKSKKAPFRENNASY